MKKILVTSALAALALMPASAQKVNKSSGGYPITPVPFTSVKVWNNTFWGQRIETSPTRSVNLSTVQFVSNYNLTLLTHDKRETTIFSSPFGRSRFGVLTAHFT